MTETGKDLSDYIKRVDFLHEISLKISESKPLQVLLDEIMYSSQLVMDAEASSFLLYSEEDGRLHFHVVQGEAENILKEYTVEIGSGIAGWVAQHKTPLIVNDCYSDPRFNPFYDKQSKFRTKSMICVPLLRRDTLLGVLSVINKKNGEYFLDADLHILETLAGQCAVAIENARLLDAKIKNESIKKELETAREIQQSLLPHRLPEFDDLDISATVIPAMEVGGDYYSVNRLPGNKTLFFIADVSGKGIPASLIVSTLDAALHTFLKLENGSLDPVKLTKVLNRVLMDIITGEKFATAWLGILDHSTKILTSINMGHNPPMIFKKGDPDPLHLRTGGMFLGIMDLEYVSESVRLESDDLLLFYSDGVTEAANPSFMLYGEENLIRFINGMRSNASKTIVEELVKDIRTFTAGARQSDDIALGVVKILK